MKNMNKVERDNIMEDKWPVFSKKKKNDFLDFLEKASKARFFDVDECDCDSDKKAVSC